VTQYGLRILPQADADVDGIAVFIAKDSVERASGFYDAVVSTYKRIVEHPKRWPVYGFAKRSLKDLRKYSVVGFSDYLVFYRIDADMVEIVRVVHGARDLPALFGA
jgi:toxin ParE1/3/4